MEETSGGDGANAARSDQFRTQRSALAVRENLGDMHFLALAGVLGPAGCIGERPEKCTYHSDCRDSFCSAQGFCVSECDQDRDCPCGSVCVKGCGLCVREDGAGLATCFAINRGVSAAEALGSCVLPPQSANGAAGAAGQTESTRACGDVVAPPLTCIDSPQGSGGSGEDVGGAGSSSGGSAQNGMGGVDTSMGGNGGAR